jgi:hypothetical protein
MLDAGLRPAQHPLRPAQMAGAQAPPAPGSMIPARTCFPVSEFSRQFLTQVILYPTYKKLRLKNNPVDKKCQVVSTKKR